MIVSKSKKIQNFCFLKFSENPKYDEHITHHTPSTFFFKFSKFFKNLSMCAEHVFQTTNKMVQVIYEGFEGRKRSMSGTLGSSWRSRYFVLRHDVVAYFGKQEDVETDTPRGRLYLSPDAILGIQTGVKNCLKMLSANRTLVAQCDTKKSWTCG